MRVLTLYVAAVVILPASCFGLVALPHPYSRAAKTAMPRRHGNTEQGLKLTAGGGPSLKADAASTASSTDAGTASSLSRARDVLLDPVFRNMHLPLMATAGAVLGPNLDNYHSAFGVLTYKNPIELSIAGHVLVTTDWWVPPLFAVAGAGIGGLYILLDAAFETPQAKREPAWRDVFLSISLFSFQYYLSGLLTAAGCPYWVLVASLAVIAERVFNLFDATRVGMFVSLATATLGPLIEVLLVNVTDLYMYNSSDFFGVDSWIPVVYFCGGPAVGSLARALYVKLHRE